jgi:pyrroloquinoline quinone (PQQ) biosynthesis protein C
LGTFFPKNVRYNTVHQALLSGWIKEDEMNVSVEGKLKQFSEQEGLTGLTIRGLKAISTGTPGYTVSKGKQFLAFQKRIHGELLNHRVIHRNAFTAWFKQGDLSLEQVRAFVVQFSVFSNLFLVAQLLKVINADSLDGMRASKEILANEIGVIFSSARMRPKAVKDPDQEGDPALVSTEGTVDGGTFRFQAAHFEWLLTLGQKLGLTFGQMGKKRHGKPSTLHFCNELARLYGSEDYEISQAASYAVENWAAAGFWKELIQGLTVFKKTHIPDLPLAFFTWHDKIESQHAQHTQEELEEYYFEHDIQETHFIQYGNQMLDAVAVFWDGLDAQRKEIARSV